jgi:hypothetical protein
LNSNGNFLSFALKVTSFQCDIVIDPVKNENNEITVFILNFFQSNDPKSLSNSAFKFGLTNTSGCLEHFSFLNTHSIKRLGFGQI